MGSIVILIVIAVLISVILSYCAAYYREFYLLQTGKVSSDNGVLSDSDNSNIDDVAEKKETENIDEYITAEDSSETDKSGKDVLSKPSKSDSITENDSVEPTPKESRCNASFLKIQENLFSLKKGIILFFLVFSIIAAIIIILLYDKLTAVKGIQYILYSDCLFLIATIDYKVKRIPNKLILFLFCLRICDIICEIVFDAQPWYALLTSSAIGMAVGIITVLICLLISRGGIGAGDLKMFAVIGMFYGLQGLMEIMIYSLFLASIVGIILLITRKAKFKSSLAMAPFMFIGSMLHIWTL